LISELLKHGVVMLSVGIKFTKKKNSKYIMYPFGYYAARHVLNSVGF
jgi:hypothetical protein